MAPGLKTGGRGKGSINKATVIKQMVTESLASPEGRAALADALQKLTAPLPGQKKAVQVLREMMMLSGTLVAINQPKPNAAGELEVKDNDRLQAYLNIAVRASDGLAKYESPTFKAIAVQEVPPVPQGASAQAGGPAGSVRKMSQKDAMATYMRVVRGGKV